ncbi:MAG: hypothetical protein EPN91_02100 [Salinibacterium sp.]|nr:MAG: hypothetical protein EPN91_02100 [Salinibacterium sp.]
MTKRLLPPLACLLLALPLLAGVTTITPATPSGASGTTGEFNVSGPNKFNWQLCTTGFSGVVSFNQGSVTGKLVTTKSVSLSTSTACTEYYWFNPSTLTSVTWTRSAGTVDNLYLEYFPK